MFIHEISITKYQLEKKNVKMRLKNNSSNISIATITPVYVCVCTLYSIKIMRQMLYDKKTITLKFL